MLGADGINKIKDTYNLGLKNEERVELLEFG